ncbi:hypothetical protein [Trabulsiella odontotermitis]|uniref:hypothetical protein n=1 Tax=Trabulsiella odontotermitis TaxID=379893 RepID=UPI0006BA2EF0|nr:hypothetical protein [Trabulsiella odontotermitis]
MNRKKIWFYILFVLSFSAHMQVSEAKDVWVFDKVSSSTLLGMTDVDRVRNLTKQFRQVEIVTDSKILTIQNPLLAKVNICSIDFVRINKTLLSYFYSKDTVKMYKVLFSHEGKTLTDDIVVLTSLRPGEECPEPYSEFIENKENLFFSEQDYVVFMKRKTGNVTSENKDKIDFWQYCKGDLEGETYDGRSKYSCKFSQKSISEVYSDIRANSHYKKALKKNLPGENLKYPFNGGYINYQWVNRNMLEIMIEQENESVRYSIKSKNNTVDVEIESDTQY